MHKTFLKLAALIAAVSVGLGAFAAHALKNMVSDASIAIFETAVRYQFYHVFALAICAILYKDFRNTWILNAGRLFLFGMLFFSGSLYVLAAMKAMVKPGYDWVGAITPVGGLMFILGWLLFFAGLFKPAK